MMRKFFATLVAVVALAAPFSIATAAVSSAATAGPANFAAADNEICGSCGGAIGPGGHCGCS